MNTTLEIGKLLRSSTTGCVMGCAATQLEAPHFGGMVSIPLGQGYTIYGLIYNINIDDDGLVRQLVTAGDISPEIIEDNRLNRNVPLEISVLFTGYQLGGRLFHLLPPRPALTLDAIYPCPDEEIVRFTGHGRFGYFRHILRAADVPVAELLAAHLQQAGQANHLGGHPEWLQRASQELITILRDDYPTLMNVLGAISDLSA